MKKGGYVQGTVQLVLRKRFEDERAYEDELAVDIKREVVHQIETLTGLNQRVKERQQRDENLFEDADLQMAGYAAALRVLTRSEEHTSELQSLMRISYAVFCLKKNNIK